MKKQIILSIIGGLVIFIFGAAIGIFYQMQQPFQLSPTSLSNQNQATDLSKILSSKVVPIYANGTVVSVSGKNITLTSNGDNLVIPASDTAAVYLFTQPGGGKSPYYQPAQLSGIKVGDKLNINLIFSNNKFTGQSIYIFPASLIKAANGS